MSTPFDIGKGISENIRFVSMIGSECAHLTRLIREELSRLLLDPVVVTRYRAAGGWEDADDYDNHDWVCTDKAYSLPMTIRPKRLASRYIAFQLSLTGLGVEAKDNDEPLLHIAWWRDAIDLGDTKMGFPLEPGEYDLTVEAERLFRWSHPQGDTEWCYSVRLTDLNNPMDVQTNIVKPVKALLLDDQAQALSGTAAVRYAAVEGEPGQFRVLPR